jgi:ribose 5-phosphate isomerase B
MRVAIGSDHAGFPLKDWLREVLRELGVEVQDLGTHDETSVDYVDFARRVAEAVAGGEADRGIAICGTGVGTSITANKVPGIRAALCHEGYTARMSREHNDANVLCLGGRVVGRELAAEIVRIFLSTNFGGGRHARRVDKIAELERSQPVRSGSRPDPVPAGPPARRGPRSTRG